MTAIAERVVPRVPETRNPAVDASIGNPHVVDLPEPVPHAARNGHHRRRGQRSGGILAVAGTPDTSTPETRADIVKKVVNEHVTTYKQATDETTRNAAMQELLTVLRPEIVRFCRNRLGRVEHARISADDVAQEALLAVIAALPGFIEQGKSFIGFAFGIAAHKIVDAHRATGRNKSEPVADVPDRPTGDSPLEAVLEGEQSAMLNTLLDEVPEQQREILLLRLAVGLSAEETAEAVGSTPGAVRVAQHRALGRVRKRLGISEIARTDAQTNTSTDNEPQQRSSTKKSLVEKEYEPPTTPGRRAIAFDANVVGSLSETDQEFLIAAESGLGPAAISLQLGIPQREVRTALGRARANYARAKKAPVEPLQVSVAEPEVIEREIPNSETQVFVRTTDPTDLLQSTAPSRVELPSLERDDSEDFITLFTPGPAEHIPLAGLPEVKDALREQADRMFQTFARWPHKRKVQAMRLAGEFSQKQYAERAGRDTSVLEIIDNGGRTNGAVLLELYNASPLQAIDIDGKFKQSLFLSNAGKNPMTIEELATVEGHELVRYLCILKGKTVKDMAEQIDMPRSTVEHYVLGSYNPSQEFIEKFTNWLELPEDAALSHIIAQRTLSPDKPIDPNVLHQVTSGTYLFVEEPLTTYSEEEFAELFAPEKSFPGLLKVRRNQAGLSQKALAEKYGSYQGEISAYERGIMVPEDYIAARMGRGLGFTPYDMEFWDLILRAEQARDEKHGYKMRKEVRMRRTPQAEVLDPDVLAVLDNKYAEVLVLQSEGLSIGEIAEQLDLNQGTVKSRARLGMRKYKILGEKHPDAVHERQGEPGDGAEGMPELKKEEFLDKVIDILSPLPIGRSLQAMQLLEGVTQNELAQRTGIHKDMIRKIINGHPVTPERIRDIVGSTKIGQLDTNRKIEQLLLAKFGGSVPSLTEEEFVRSVSTDQSVGEMLKQKRLELGLSLGQAGEPSGVRSQDLWKVETGRKTPRGPTILDIARGMGITLLKDPHTLWTLLIKGEQEYLAKRGGTKAA